MFSLFFLHSCHFLSWQSNNDHGMKSSCEYIDAIGCKIKALRAKTNTYIKTPVRGEEPVFVVTGRKEDVAAAKREILSAAEHFSQIRAQRKNSLTGGAGGQGGLGPGPAIPGQTTIQVRVPYRVVGLVVGPKGATIKRIQQQTNTYIITPSRDKEPIFEVTGLPESVETAKKEIEAHIAMRTGGVIDSSTGESTGSSSSASSVEGGSDPFATSSNSLSPITPSGHLGSLSHHHHPLNNNNNSLHMNQLNHHFSNHHHQSSPPPSSQMNTSNHNSTLDYFSTTDSDLLLSILRIAMNDGGENNSNMNSPHQRLSSTESKSTGSSSLMSGLHNMQQASSSSSSSALTNSMSFPSSVHHHESSTKSNRMLIDLNQFE